MNYKDTQKNVKSTTNQNSDRTITESYDYLSNAASSQDCTGLIPAAPSSDAEIEAYEELYHFLPPFSETKNQTTSKK